MPIIASVKFGPAASFECDAAWQRYRLRVTALPNDRNIRRPYQRQSGKLPRNERGDRQEQAGLQRVRDDRGSTHETLADGACLGPVACQAPQGLAYEEAPLGTQEIAQKRI